MHFDFRVFNGVIRGTRLRQLEGRLWKYSHIFLSHMLDFAAGYSTGDPFGCNPSPKLGASVPWVFVQPVAYLTALRAYPLGIVVFFVVHRRLNQKTSICLFDLLGTSCHSCSDLCAAKMRTDGRSRNFVRSVNYVKILKATCKRIVDTLVATRAIDTHSLLCRSVSIFGTHCLQSQCHS